MTIIAIDHGYAQMKTPHCVFNSGITEAILETEDARNILHYQGQAYQIGTKRMNHDKDKTKNANYYLLTLALIAKEIEAQNLSRRLSVDLSVGLLLVQMKRDTEKFKRYLMQNEETIYFVFENNEYEITINSIRVNAQGFAGVFHEWIYGDLEQDEPILKTRHLFLWAVAQAF